RGPSRKTIRRRLGVAYHQYRQQLRTTLAHVNTIVITVDIWTKNKQSFICLTGHAFNKKYESIPLVLGFRHFAGPHKSKSIKKYILYELKQLQIEDKICAIVSDNGGDIKKAVNDIKPDQRISCIAHPGRRVPAVSSGRNDRPGHNINLVVKNGLGLWEKSEKKKKTIQQTTTDAFDDYSESENDTQSDSYAIEVPEEVEDEAMSDTENSTDSEGESDDGGGNTYDDESNAEDEAEDDTANEYATDEDEQLLQPENIHYLLIRLVKRIRSCIVNIRCTRAVSDYVKREAKSIDPPIKAGLVTDLEIRWNTTFIMIDRFNTHRSIVDDINSRPFKIAHTSSAQQIKLVQYALRHFLWKTSENDSIWFKSLQTCLREKFHLYFDEKIGQHQKNASLIAAFLDPVEYHHLRKRPVELEAAIVLLKVEMEQEAKRIALKVRTSHSRTDIACDLSSKTNPPKKEKEKENNIDSLFSLCGIAVSSVPTSSIQKTWSINEEIGFYISSVNTDKQLMFASFWFNQEKRLPLMSSVVRRINIIPASSVPCESTFSVAGYIRRKERCSLSPQAIRYSMVLKDRHKLALFDH
ncbi:unnamed protein product, partial [Rotaria magnacalcarata]